MDRAQVGVVVGRFQVEELTEGHKGLLDYVAKRHEQMLVLLGVSPVLVGRKDPLDFATRKLMIQDRYPQAVVLPIKDVGNPPLWSRNLDALVRSVYPTHSILLYHGRDSFKNCYTGSLPTQEVSEQAVNASALISGTVARQWTLHGGPRQSNEFRAGVIYAANHQYPKVYPTVDMAVLTRANGTGNWQVVMGQRTGSNFYRFPGGFVDPTDLSMAQAARREVKEEVGLDLSHVPAQYVGSYLVNDWRYPGPDRIMTSLFAFVIKDQLPVVGSDDLAAAAWLDVMDTDHGQIIHTHMTLWSALYRYTKWLDVRDSDGPYVSGEWIPE